MEEVHGDLTRQFEKLEIDKNSEKNTADAAKYRTGLVYDEEMTKHFNQWDSTHPECPERISSIYNKHQEYGLTERCKTIPSRHATHEELLTVHEENFIKFMEETASMKNRDLFQKGEELESIYLSPHTYECATLSAGCALNITQAVVNGEVQNGAAIIRPPGHHAESNCCMGFCYFNNVAIVTKIAQSKWGVGKILIVDWDIHHGNGTQKMFESDPSVLYFSLHRYDHGTFYPGTTYGNFDVVGSGSGTGYTVNIPWNKRHIGDADYLAAFHYVLMPIAYEFCPELVIVSAGFDSARGDPKGLCDVTPECFSHLTQMLLTLANGKLSMILEGGYNLTSIAESMSACTSTLLGDPCPVLEPGLVPCESALISIANARDTHSKFWKSLLFSLVMPEFQYEDKNQTEQESNSGYTSDENYVPTPKTPTKEDAPDTASPTEPDQH